MTPTEQDKELREAIVSRLQHAYYNRHTDGIAGIYSHAPSILENYTDEIMQLITAHTNKQVEAKLVHISEYAENVISIDENGEFSMKAIPLSLVAVERNKLKEANQ